MMGMPGVVAWHVRENAQEDRSMTAIQEDTMSTGAKFLLGTIAGFLAVAYSWIFRAKKVQSTRHELGERPGEPRHW
jgi:hypothetical protein